MKQFVIDGNDFNDEEGFRLEAYRVFWPSRAKKLQGLNLDSFNDVLSGGFGVFEVDEPIQLTWKNAKKSKSDLGYDAYVRHYERIKLRAHPSNLEIIDGKIERAKEHEGPTLFDLIVDVISDHKHITFVET